MVFTIVSCGNDTADATTPLTTEATTEAVTEATTVATTEATTVATTEAVTEATTEATTAEEPYVPPVYENAEFDESRIVLSLAAVSDTHVIEKQTDVSVTRLRGALAQLENKAQEHDADGLDGVLVVGDLINNASRAQLEIFKQTYEKSVDIDKVPLIYCLGDDHDVDWDTDCSDTIAMFISTFGEKYYTTDIEPDMIPTGNRHCVIGGYHFICLEPTHRSPITYPENVKEWLDATLAELTAENPNQYVFILTHAMITDTCYGSDLGTAWATSDLTDILSKYPQVITFGGHLHYPINDERSIMQDKFTSVGCGAVRYLAMEPGYQKESGTVPSDAYEVSTGLLVQLDAYGNMRITRMDLANKAEIKSAWEISYPNEDGTHLGKYTAARADINEAPVLSGDITATVNGRNVTLNFAAASDDDMIHHYVVTLTKKSTGRSSTAKYLSGFYRKPQPSDMAKTFSCLVETLTSGAEYSASVVAVDSWGAESNALTVDFMIP
ncbi:MAG: hypothetical protein MJ101_07555 [Clostridia bacterium]|nr:hypothetical protein [Clostridia bacterium]